MTAQTTSTVRVRGVLQYLTLVLALVLIGFTVGTFILTNISIVNIRHDVATTLYADALIEIGMSPVVYAFYLPALQGIAILIGLIVALIILSKRSEEPIAVVLAITMVAFASMNLYHNDRLAVIAPSLWTAQAVIVLIGLSVDSLLLYFFPSGRPYPRWVLWFFLPNMVLHLFTASYMLNSDVSSPGALLAFSLEIAFTALTLGAQFLRYRTLKPEQRQQVKWVLAGFVSVFGAISIFILSQVVLTPMIPPGSVGRLLFDLTVDDGLHFASLILLSLTIANAILRRRLWDIDFAINQALGIVAALLTMVVVFTLIAIGLNQLLPLGTTLLITAVISAALFIPVRHFLQGVIDMHLYGMRQPVAEFTAIDDTKPAVSRPGVYTGKTLDGIELLDFVARGGMGEVYKGFADGRVYAVKILPAEHDEENALRFAQEAEVLRRIRHDNIVGLNRFGSADGLHYLAMDYVEGMSLRTYLLRSKRLPLEIVCKLVNDLASALDYIHGLGIIHRDLKPGNIMLTLDESGVPTKAILLDFGIARIVEMSITQTGMGNVGTVEYIAPEQILSSRTVTSGADIYALGVIVYEMLTGERPFKGSTGEMLFAHLKQPAPDPIDLVPDLPPITAFTIMRAMAKSPDDRYASARHFADDLANTEGVMARMVQFY